MVNRFSTENKMDRPCASYLTSFSNTLEQWSLVSYWASISSGTFTRALGIILRLFLTNSYIDVRIIWKSVANFQMDQQLEAKLLDPPSSTSFLTKIILNVANISLTALYIPGIKWKKKPYCSTFSIDMTIWFNREIPEFQIYWTSCRDHMYITAIVVHNWCCFHFRIRLANTTKETDSFIMTLSCYLEWLVCLNPSVFITNMAM